MQKERYERGEKKLGYAGLCKELTEWRNGTATPWLKDAPTHPLQQTLKDLERAYTNFFAKRADFPRFKCKGQGDSFRYPDPKQMSPDLVFRDPCPLDFLGLSGAWSEKDLEVAILREMEAFLLEMGSGFCFVARQKRMAVGKDDFYSDLLFYHRHLRRLVAIELKLEPLQPTHTGQMALYLRWLDKHERAPGEEAPIGLILCASADAEQVALLQLDDKSIRVAEYLIELPPAELLRERLHRAMEHARERDVDMLLPDEAKR